MFPLYFKKYPKVHGIFLICIFFGVVIAWSAFILPFYIYDHLMEDFYPYFEKVKTLLKKNK